MNAILLEKLTKNYGAKLALDSIDLAVPEGSIFGLLGPNGAGKSTMINILAGTVIKTSGKASIMGVDIDDSPQLAKYQIGVVPQEIALDTFFPVREALEFYAGYYGIRPSGRKTDEILTALGLQDKSNVTARQLSGGMKRRFLVAKAMVHSPKVLILDEPTAGVDIELREQLWGYVRRLNKLGTTIILTTHYLKEAEELCDHIAFINHGKIIKSDSKTNLLGSLGCKKVTVELITEINTLPETLNEYSIEILDSGRLLLKLSAGSEIGEIITHLQSAGLVIKDLSVEQGDLEDVFRKIMN
jgi:ABC-2 type transport system ATP-binding protein